MTITIQRCKYTKTFRYIPLLIHFFDKKAQTYSSYVQACIVDCPIPQYKKTQKTPKRIANVQRKGVFCVFLYNISKQTLAMTEKSRNFAGAFTKGGIARSHIVI